MKLKFRKIAYQLHLWLGLASGLIVVIMAATGCILSFEDELKHLIHPQRYYVNAIGKEKLPLAELTANAEKALPEGLKIKRVQISSDPSRTYMFRTLKMDNEALTYWGTYVYYYRVYIDPYTGNVQEVENAKTDFFEIVLDLHRRLLLGEKVGKAITGYLTLILAVILFSGLVIWYPRKMSKSMLKGMFFIKLSANWKRINYDLHNVLGFYSMIPLLLIAYSALIWNFKDMDKWIQNFLNNNDSVEQKVKSIQPQNKSADRNIVLARIWKTVESQMVHKKSVMINFPRTEEGTYYAEITKGDKQYQNEQLNFDQYSGAKLKYQSYKDKNIGNGTALRERNYDLHVGSIFGITGRILYFLAGIVATSLPITGFIIFLNRKKKKPKHQKNKIVFPAHH